MKSWFRNVKIGLCNLWKWFPIVWNDRDWDHAYLLRVMEFKFNNMHDLFLHKGHGVNHKEQALVCFKLAYLSKRLHEDNYLMAQIEAGNPLDEFYRANEEQQKDLKKLCKTLEKELLGLWD